MRACGGRSGRQARLIELRGEVLGRDHPVLAGVRGWGRAEAPD